MVTWNLAKVQSRVRFPTVAPGIHTSRKRPLKYCLCMIKTQKYEPKESIRKLLCSSLSFDFWVGSEVVNRGRL